MLNSDSELISKVTVNDFNESAGNRKLTEELEKNNRIKAYFYENDKTPNTDGYFEVLGEESRAIKRFVVQIKTVRHLKQLKRKGYSYPANAAFFQFVLKNIDQNPAIIFVIDLSSRKLYYKYLSIEYIISLSIGDKKKVTIHLDDSDILVEEVFFDFCMKLIVERVVATTHVLTEKLMSPKTKVLYFENNLMQDYTRYENLPVGIEESKLLGIPLAISEKYDIRFLSEGGISKVFGLKSKLTGSKAVLKISPIKETVGKVLLNEYKFIDRIRHSAIPRVLDYFTEKNTEYLIMDYIEGDTFDHFVKRGVFTLAEIIGIIAELCIVTQFLGDQGITHGDIKPSNIMIGHSLSVYLMDFGAASNIGDTRETLLVTDRYTAPEKYNKKYVSNVCSEVYSIGATLYFALLNDKTNELLRMPNSCTELSEFVENCKSNDLGYGLIVLKRALAYNPKNRYKNPKEMCDDLMIWQSKECLHQSVINRLLSIA